MIGKFLEVAREHKYETAVSDEVSSLHYGELADRMQAYAEGIGRHPHPVVVSLLPGGPELTALMLGSFATHAVFSPLPSRSSLWELRHYFELLQPDIVVHGEACDLHVLDTALPDHAVRILADHTAPSKISGSALSSGGRSLPRDTVFVQFTSGSTGMRKGILLSSRSFVRNLEQSRAQLAQFEGKPVFCALPQFQAMGAAVALEHLCNGSSVHMANRPKLAPALKRIVEYECEGLLGNPNWFHRLLELGMLRSDVFPGIQDFTLGTAAADPSLVRKLRRAFPEARIHIRYGTSEAVGALSLHTIGLGEELEAPGLVGKPLPGVELVEDLPLVGSKEPGEIRVRSGALGIGQLCGRYEWEALLDDDGSYATGDLGYQDEEGRIHVCGRKSLFLKRAGQRIDPGEIERLLREQKGVADAIVLGLPDQELGQEVVACVEVLKDSMTTTRDALLASCRMHLSEWKWPSRIELFDRLPRTGAGRPDRGKILLELSS